MILHLTYLEAFVNMVGHLDCIAKAHGRYGEACMQNYWSKYLLSDDTFKRRLICTMEVTKGIQSGLATKYRHASKPQKCMHRHALHDVKPVECKLDHFPFCDPEAKFEFLQSEN
jgi:hypothetical protein